jgi:Ca2+:H+ antiporter
MSVSATRRQTPVKQDRQGRPPVRTVAVPIAALVVGLLLGLDSTLHLPELVQMGLDVLTLGLLFWTVFVVLRHAETIAHRIGEPYGTLVLTVAVTAIEASVIVSVMLQGEPNPSLARESVYSTVMIVCGGMLGLCLTLGGWRHQHQDLKRQGTNALLAVVVALSVLTLILPDYTLAAVPGSYSTMQLVLVSVLCLMLYGAFVLAQMTRHREDFLDYPAAGTHDTHEQPAHGLLVSVVLLIVGLVGIVLLAEHMAASLEEGLEALHIGQTDAIVGAFIAMLVLSSEGIAAIRAALRNELQRALNIALGSACATIGLTIPIVAAVSLATGMELTLGLKPGDTVLLLLALAISMISFGTGRTTVLTGSVHLVVFVAYLLLIAVP